MRRSARVVLLLLASAAGGGAAACGGPSHPPFVSDVFVGNDGGADANDPVLGGGDPWTGIPSCSQETQFVYVVDEADVLHRFDPPSVAFTTVGQLACPGSPFSMAIDRTGVAWVLFDDGTLARVDTRSGKCKMTPFVSGQHGFSARFGMGFSSNTPDGGDETLFVSGDAPEMLGTIDTRSLALTSIATYDALHSAAELTGTGDGRLFGAFEGQPYVVAEIDKPSAHILSQAPQAPIDYPPNAANFAFAFWGGDFYLFVGPGQGTDVFRYRPADATTVKLASVPFTIVGAGVSTCAPTVGPK
jgi:hypothetical protein